MPVGDGVGVWEVAMIGDAVLSGGGVFGLERAFWQPVRASSAAVHRVNQNLGRMMTFSLL